MGTQNLVYPSREYTAEALTKLAFDLTRAGQSQGAAVVFTDVVELTPEDVSSWSGLGSTLMDCAGTVVRKPFFEWGTAALKRARPLAPDTPFESVIEERLAQASAEIDTSSVKPLEPGALPELREFLLVHPTVMSAALCGADIDPMSMVMTLGDLGAAHYKSFIADAVRGTFGAAATRAALKRLQPFHDFPEVQRALAELAAGPLFAECQPYVDRR